MEFVAAVRSCFHKYANAGGRAPRAEYWYFFLFVVIVQVALRLTVPMMGYVFDLGIFLPSLAVGVRRLHDIDRTGQWLWIGFVPIVGTILLIVWFCKRGDDGENRFGLPPLAREALAIET
jgi:uncharacterized membrane protein YhaH (DUF805 family)